MNILLPFLALAGFTCFVRASNLIEKLQEKAIVHKHELSDQEHYSKDGVHNLEYDHEIFLGVEKAKFDKLTPEQAKKSLRALVKKIDTNEDGFVTEEEMTIWVRKVFHAMAQRDAKILMKGQDRDEDGKITWKEYEKNTFSEEELNDDDIQMKQLIRWVPFFFWGIPISRTFFALSPVPSLFPI